MVSRRRLLGRKRSRSGQQRTQVGSVRIVGGRWRGRRIDFPLDPRIRPMKDRVREAVFNILRDMVEGAHAIDLFAGTGVLGLEALSRGAASATFIERHRPTAQRLRAAAARLGAERVEIHVADTLVWLAQAENLQALGRGGHPWLVFCSPPYELYLKAWDRLGPLLERLLFAAPRGSSFVVEADDRFDATLLPQSAAWDVRQYPPAQVAVWGRET